LSNTAPNGIHQGQGIDPLNPTNNSNINWKHHHHGHQHPCHALRNTVDELEYRDDLQVMTTNVYYGVAGGWRWCPVPITRSAITARRRTKAASIPVPTPR